MASNYPHLLAIQKSARERKCEQEITEKIKQYRTTYHIMPSQDLKPLPFAEILRDTLQVNENITPNSEESQKKLAELKNFEEVNCAASKSDSFDCLSYNLEIIRSTLKKMHNRSSPAPDCISGDVPILDITKASQSDLSALLKLFKEDASFSTPMEGMNELFKFIPTAPVQASPPKHKYSCVCAGCAVVRLCDWCQQELCTHNLPVSCSAYPRTGQVSSLLCSDCINYNTQKDAEDWEKASLDFLEEPSDASIIASLGCALVAIALGHNSQLLLKKIAKKLHHHRKNKMANGILQLALSKKEKGSNKEMSIQFLGSSILKDLAKFENFSVKEKRKLILAAKDAFSLACMNLTHPDVLYAFKSVIMELLLEACRRALHTGNPGLELYTTCIAIGIIRKLGLLSASQHVFIDEDHFFLRTLVQTVSRLFPLWSPPPISLSEAGKFDQVTLHSDFIYELLFIQPENRQVNECDLTYHLYKNDLFSQLPIGNSSNFRARAMEEELKSKGLTWSDITEAMSDRYCPRDKEGWIVPNGDLDLSQHYSEVIGFTLDVSLDKPTLKLLVVKADPTTGRRGLFSPKDVATMLQFNANDEIFFSLDPPPTDLDKRHHPFQAWRYSEKLRDTEVLKTMFLADYLMKSFVSGVDISSQPPFKQRACKDGLLKNLPSDVQEALRPIHERRSSTCISSEERYWIELAELKYKEIKDATQYDCRIGEVRVEIKSEYKDSNTSESNRPRALFTKDMKSVYTKLCNHFPVFARLQELYKLHFFSLKLQTEIKNLMAQCPDKAHALKKFLEYFKRPPSPATGKHIFVPALVSPQLHSVIYGGVQFCKNFHSVPAFHAQVGAPWEKAKEMFVTACEGNKLLHQAYQPPLEIVGKGAVDILLDILDPSGGGVRHYDEKIPAVYILDQCKVTPTDACEARELKVGVSCDVFREVEEYASVFQNFTFLPLRKGITDDAVNFCLTAIQCTSSNLSSIAGSKEIGGVRFTVNAKLCQDNNFFLPSNVTEVDSEAFLPSNSSEVIDQPDFTREIYPTSEISLRQQMMNSGETCSLGTSIVANLLRDKTNGTLFAKKSLTFSFREENSSSLNKQIGRLSAYTELGQPIDQ